MKQGAKFLVIGYAYTQALNDVRLFSKMVLQVYIYENPCCPTSLPILHIVKLLNFCRCGSVVISSLFSCFLFFCFVLFF